MNTDIAFDRQIKPKKKERWYLVIFAFFAVVFAANCFMVWLAVESTRGLTIDKQYEHGIR